jgi:pyruvate kinase
MSSARTCIIATVGPACASAATLAAMAAAGTRVFRLNGAHVEGDEVAGWVRRVRRAARRAGRTVAVMVDLPGVKMRIGKMRGGATPTLEAGARVRLAAGTRGGDAGHVPVHPWPDVSAVRPGRRVLLDDGRLRLRVTRRVQAVLHAVVEEGGVLREGEGVALPGTSIDLAVPTRADLALARAAVEAGADWLGLSFVHDASDVQRLRRACARAGAPAMPIASKIERGDAFPGLEEIVQASDAVVVARGDLGTDVGAEHVPALQATILETAHRRGRPAVVATEMLDSMTRSARPTRAEVSDVAGAVGEGTDAVLLSQETAVGAHPVLAVRTLDRILTSAEDDPRAPYAGDARLAHPASLPGRPDQHVVHAAVLLAQETRARAIVVFTRGGQSAVRLSKERPRARVHAFAPTTAVCRRLALAWGVSARRLPAARGTDAVAAQVTRRLRADGLLAPGERAVLVMGGPEDPAGATTLVRLLAP